MGATFRANMYRLLSLVFSEPSDKCVTELDNLLDNLTKESHFFSEHFDATDLYLSLSSERDNILEECVKLFGKSRGSGFCSPYERDYRGEKVLSSIKSLYNEIGFEPSEDVIDHVSIELEFAYRVLSSNINVDKRDKILIDFLKEHLLTWINKFIECVKNNTKSKFYIKAINTLEQLISYEREYLGII